MYSASRPKRASVVVIGVGASTKDAEREFRRLTGKSESTDALATRHIATEHTRASVVVIARRPSMRSRV